MSATGDALEALYAALTAKAQEAGAAIPAPLQNESLSSRIAEAVGGAGIVQWVNVWDGSAGDGDEMLGAGLAGSQGYAIEHRAAIEYVVAGGDRAGRRAAIEAGLEAIDDAIGADRTLAGTCAYAEITEIVRQGQGLAIDGLPDMLGAAITVTLSIISARPF